MYGTRGTPARGNANPLRGRTNSSRCGEALYWPWFGPAISLSLPAGPCRGVYIRWGRLPVSFFGGGGGVSVVPLVFGVVMFPVNVGWKRALVSASNPDAN